MNTNRHTVPALENLLDVPLQVLDHGFVKLVDYMGSEDSILQAARVSYSKQSSKGEKADTTLLRYLMRSGHSSPFEQVVLTLHCKMPIFVARQIVRHRTARLNEVSGRYSVMKDEFYVPAEEDICYQSTANKQGRSGPLPLEDAYFVQSGMKASNQQDYLDYIALLDMGIAKETARMNLPLALYTEWFWQIDLSNLMKFLSLRCDAHAQKEVRVYAEAMYKIVLAGYPNILQAFDDYDFRRNAVLLTAPEIEVLRWMINRQLAYGSLRSAFNAVPQTEGQKEKFRLSDREWTEVEAKFKKMGVL